MTTPRGWIDRSQSPLAAVITGVNQSSAACLVDRQAELDTPIERILRERTDLLGANSRVLHIAPEGRLRATLSDLDRLDYHCTEPVDGAPGSLELGFVAWSFDVVICDGDKATGERRLPLREIARMLRPGGRAILTAPRDEPEEDFGELVAREGFFAARLRVPGETTVFVCVRGEL